MAERAPNAERVNNRIVRQITGNRAYGALSTNSQGMNDISVAGTGMNGFMPNYAGLVNNSKYTRRPVIAALYEAPRGFDFLPQSQVWKDTLKQLIEVHAEAISGLTSTTTWSFSDVPIGRAGERMQDPTDARVEPCEPQFTWTDMKGRPIQTFLKGWGNGLIMHPETNIPTIMSSTGPKPYDLNPDFMSATVLFMETDPTGTRVEKAWLCANMMPQSAGEEIGAMDLTSAQEPLELQITFTAVTQRGMGVHQLAQDWLDQMNYGGVNPNLAPPMVEKIEADLANSGVGLQASMDQASRDAIVSTDPSTSEAIRSQYQSVQGDTNSSVAPPDLGPRGTQYREDGYPV